MDFFCCDLSQSGDATRAVQYVMKKKGGIDLLVINTGGPLKGNFEAYAAHEPAQFLGFFVLSRAYRRDTD
jgi:NAD(P)-dependent dehydrogenase (short-subunit alcohol dehydrogenase family)